MSKSEDVQEKKELVNIQVFREDIEQIVIDQHEKFSKTDLSLMGQK